MSLGASVEWFIGISAAVIGALVWELARSGFQSFAQSKGPLGGYWYQVTFNPEQRAEIWSIELLRVKQAGEELRGSMWRIFRNPNASNAVGDDNAPHYDRSWRFLGRYHGNFVRGTYWSRSGNGGDGIMGLFQVNRSECEGTFKEEQPVHGDSGPAYIPFEAPLKWVKAGSEQESTILSLVLSNGYQEIHQLQWPARRVIRRRLRGKTRGSGTSGSLPNAGVTSDLSDSLSINKQDGPN